MRDGLLNHIEQPCPVDDEKKIPNAFPASTVRRRILVLLMLYAALCHFNRISMSVAGTEQIMGQYGISETQMGWVYTSYLIVYTLCMTPGGLLMDRRGARVALVIMGFGSALFAGLTGLVGVLFRTAEMAAPFLISLLVIRSLLGGITAPIHPGCARLVGHWIPPAGRASANGVISAAALLGIASVYMVFGELVDWLGWPLAFAFSGAVTAVVAVLWTSYATEYPAQHPAVNSQERELIRGSEVVEDGRDSQFAWAGRSLLVLTLGYGMLNYFEYLFFFWMQYYYMEVLELSKETSRIYSTLPTLAMAAGMFLGGWLADRLQARFGRRLGLGLVPAGGMIASAGLLVAGVMVREPVLVVLFFSLSMAAAGASEGPFWTRAIELGGQRSGTAAAIMNTGGNAGGLLAPVLTPFIGRLIGWEGSFGLAAVLCLCGGLLWCWIHPPMEAQKT